MEQNQNQFKCSGDCLNCRKLPNERREQWQYCAAQFTYNSMRMIESMQQSLLAMQGTIGDVKAKIEAIQNSEANVYNPNEERQSDDAVPGRTVQDITQSGDGV